MLGHLKLLRLSELLRSLELLEYLPTLDWYSKLGHSAGPLFVHTAPENPYSYVNHDGNFHSLIQNTTTRDGFFMDLLCPYNRPIRLPVARKALIESRNKFHVHVASHLIFIELLEESFQTRFVHWVSDLFMFREYVSQSTAWQCVAMFNTSVARHQKSKYGYVQEFTPRTPALC